MENLLKCYKDYFVKRKYDLDGKYTESIKVTSWVG